MVEREAESIRAFFALALPAEVGHELDRVVDGMRREAWAKPIRWVRSENRHVTIRFLGQVERDALGELARRVDRMLDGLAGFRLGLKRLGLFPNPVRPHVVAAELAIPDALETLARAVEAAVVAHGLPAAEHPFRPHITLGRIRGRLASRPDVEHPLAAVEMAVHDVRLYQSVLRPSGAVYSQLARIELGPRPADAGEDASRVPARTRRR